MLERFLRRALNWRKSGTEHSIGTCPSLPSLPEQFPEIAHVSLRRELARVNDYCEIYVGDWPISPTGVSEALVPPHELGWKKLKAAEMARYVARKGVVETSTGPVWYNGPKRYWFTQEQTLAVATLHHFYPDYHTRIQKLVVVTKEALGTSPLAEKIYLENAPVVPFENADQHEDSNFLTFMEVVREGVHTLSWSIGTEELANIISQLSYTARLRSGIFFTNDSAPYAIRNQLNHYIQWRMIDVEKIDHPTQRNTVMNAFDENHVLAASALIYSWLRMRRLVEMEGVVYKTRELLGDNPLVNLIHDPQREKKFDRRSNE